MWEKITLKSCVNVLSGFAFKSSLFTEEAEYIPIIRIRDIKRSYSDTFYKGDYKEEYIVRKGDFVIGMDGEFNIAEWKGIPSLLNQRVCKISSTNKSLLNEKYLFYIISTYLKKIEDKTSFVTVKHLSVNDIRDIEIPLPPLPIQEKIAEILDKADELRRKDKDLQAKYDELAKAIFIDMFGDPVRNEKGWEVKKVKEVAGKGKYSIKAGPFGSSLKKEFYIKEGYKVYGQEQVIADDLSIGNYYIDESKYKELKSCSINSSDILISLVGTYGKISIVPTIFEEGIINPRLMKITLDQNIYLPYFFKFLMQTKEMRNYISTYSRGGTMDILNVGIISNLDVIIPPIHLQKALAKKIELINQLKAQTNVEKSEELFQSLLQKAFKGELVS